MEMLTVDKLGRILLPKALRDALGLRAGARLLAVELDGRLVLQAVDAETLLRQVRKDLQGTDVERITREIRDEVELEARAHIEEVLAGHKRPRGGDPTAAAPDRKSSPRRDRPGR